MPDSLGLVAMPKAWGKLNRMTVQKPASALPELITLQQAAERTQISARTLRRYIAEGRLVAYRMGRAIRLKPEDVAALFTPTNKWSGGAA